MPMPEYMKNPLFHMGLGLMSVPNQSYAPGAVSWGPGIQRGLLGYQQSLLYQDREEERRQRQEMQQRKMEWEMQRQQAAQAQAAALSEAKQRMLPNLPPALKPLAPFLSVDKLAEYSGGGGASPTDQKEAWTTVANISRKVQAGEPMSEEDTRRLEIARAIIQRPISAGFDPVTGQPRMIRNQVPGSLFAAGAPMQAPPAAAQQTGPFVPQQPAPELSQVLGEGPVPAAPQGQPAQAGGAQLTDDQIAAQLGLAPPAPSQMPAAPASPAAPMAAPPPGTRLTQEQASALAGSRLEPGAYVMGANGPVRVAAGQKPREAQSRAKVMLPQLLKSDQDVQAVQKKAGAGWTPGRVESSFMGGLLDPAYEFAQETLGGALPKGMDPRSDEFRSFESAARNWTTHYTYVVSGAQAGPSETEQHYRNFFPVPGDSEQEIKAKEVRRRLAMESIKAMAEE